MKDLHVFLLVSALVLTGYVVLLNSIGNSAPSFRTQQDGSTVQQILPMERVIAAPITTEHLKPKSEESFAASNTFPHYTDKRPGVIILGMHRSGTSGRHSFFLFTLSNNICF
jgi:hypothetical protein